MALQILNMQGLVNIDQGMLAAAVDLALENSVRDLRDRPHITTPRKIVIELTIKPTKFDRDGTLAQVEIGYGLDEKMPRRKSGPTACGVKHNGKLFFNELSPDNPYQATFDLERRPEEPQ